MSKKKKTILFRRKREGKTDYKKRLKLLLANKPRLVIRRTNTSMILQLIEYSPKGDKVIASVISSELKRLGWKASFSNLPASYLAGLLLGKKAGEKKVKEAILDIGLQKSIKGSRIYASLKGALDAGLKVVASTEIIPKEDRISGKHISEYAKKLKEDKAKYEKQFSRYIKDNFAPEDIESHFNEIKSKITSEPEGK